MKRHALIMNIVYAVLLGVGGTLAILFPALSFLVALQALPIQGSVTTYFAYFIALYLYAWMVVKVYKAIGFGKNLDNPDYVAKDWKVEMMKLEKEAAH